MIGVLITNNIVAFIIMNVIFFALNSIIILLIQDLIVKYTTNKNNSIVMGFYNAIKSLGGIIGALLAGFFYTFDPHLPFIFGLISFLLATLLSLYYIKNLSKK